jgi:threonylcarbamoyladenosine tRNA methylthiotransferase MtaB
MPGVAVPVRRERAEALRNAALPLAARFHAAQIGRRVRVVVERGGTGHSEHFARVRLGDEHRVGDLLEVQVIAADAAGLEAG